MTMMMTYKKISHPLIQKRRLTSNPVMLPPKNIHRKHIIAILYKDITGLRNINSLEVSPLFKVLVTVMMLSLMTLTADVPPNVICGLDGQQRLLLQNLNNSRRQP